MSPVTGQGRSAKPTRRHEARQQESSLVLFLTSAISPALKADWLLDDYVPSGWRPHVLQRENIRSFLRVSTAALMAFDMWRNVGPICLEKKSMLRQNHTPYFAQLMLIMYLVLFDLIGNAIASAKCRQAEYQLGGECCPTCPPGMHVNRHCTEIKSTSCASCTEGTFQDGDNGREQCFSCKHCDPGLGLKVKKSCSSTSDAVCEVLDGFFCSDSNRGGCRAAQRHTVCSPGQYIGQRGTADKDTECLHCTDGTFSDGTLSSCQNYKKCESVGLKLMRPGTDSTDSECGEHGPHRGLVVGIILVILVMALIIIAIFIQKKKLIEWISTLKPKQNKDRRSEHQQSELRPMGSLS